MKQKCCWPKSNETFDVRFSNERPKIQKSKSQLDRILLCYKPKAIVITFGFFNQINFWNMSAWKFKFLRNSEFGCSLYVCTLNPNIPNCYTNTNSIKDIWEQKKPPKIANYFYCKTLNVWNPNCWNTNLSDIRAFVSSDFRHPYVSEYQTLVRISDISQKCLKSKLKILDFRHILKKVSEIHTSSVFRHTVSFCRQVKTVNATSRGPILQLLWRAFNRHLPDLSKYGIEQVILKAFTKLFFLAFFAHFES